VTAEHDPSKRFNTQGLCVTTLSDTKEHNIDKVFCSPVTSQVKQPAKKAFSLILNEEIETFEEEVNNKFFSKIISPGRHGWKITNVSFNLRECK